MFLLVQSNISLPGFICMYSFSIRMWHPAHTTTYVLPVFEIEQIIEQLQVSLTGDTVNLGAASNITAQIRKQISNWNAVLLNYRSHNEGLTPMFTVDDIMFMNMTKSFNLWTEGIITDSDLVNVIEGEKQADDDVLTESYIKDINGARTSTRNSVNDNRNVARFLTATLYHLQR